MLTATERRPRNANGLTQSELEFFHAKGYVLVRQFLSPDHMRRLADETEGLHQKMAEHAPPEAHVAWEEGLAAGRPQRIRQLMHSEKVSPMIDAISKSPEMLAIMNQLIGPDVLLYHSKLMMKAAHDGTFTPWHQDWGYWQHSSKESTQINCMLAIDAADVENGAIRFVDGSHKLGPVSHAHFQSNSFNTGIPGDLSAYDATLLEMGVGDAVFFGPMVIHGSGPNASSRDRRANTFAFDKPDNEQREQFDESRWRCGRKSTPKA